MLDNHTVRLARIVPRRLQPELSAEARSGLEGLGRETDESAAALAAKPHNPLRRNSPRGRLAAGGPRSSPDLAAAAAWLLTIRSAQNSGPQRTADPTWLPPFIRPRCGQVATCGLP
jgi:hypothetical protein